MVEHKRVRRGKASYQVELLVARELRRISKPSTTPATWQGKAKLKDRALLLNKLLERSVKQAIDDAVEAMDGSSI